MGIPALEFRVLPMLQDVLLALEVWVIIADEGPALHTDWVDPVHEAAVLEVVAVAADLQLPPGETFPLIEHDLFLWPQQWKYFVFRQTLVQKMSESVVVREVLNYCWNNIWIRTSHHTLSEIDFFVTRESLEASSVVALYSLVVATHLSWVLRHFPLFAVPN